jgi:hypothetical protein
VAVNIKGFFYRSLFFAGWLLSPLTFWNDAFINIPLAYLCASLVFGLAHFNARTSGRADFIVLVLVFYWLSNILGLVIMFLSGRQMAREEAFTKEALLKTVLTVLVYSIVLVLLNNSGILKPVQLPVK